MQKQIRGIGTIGTASRVVVGLGLLYFALADGLSWGLSWREAGLGLVAFPAVMSGSGWQPAISRGDRSSSWARSASP